MPTKSSSSVVNIIVSGQGTPWELALLDLLSPDCETVMVNGDRLTSNLSKSGLCILRLPVASVVRTMIESGVEAIILSDSIDGSWPDHWIVLPLASSLLNVAKVANILASQRSLKDRQILSVGQIDLEAYSQSCSIWDKLQQFSASLDRLDTLPQQLQEAARLLEDSLFGARVFQIGGRAEEGDFLVLASNDLRCSSRHVNREFVRLLESSSRVVIDSSAAGGFRAQLARYQADLILAFRGKDALLGWFLIDFEDRHQVLVNKPLAEKFGRHLSKLLTYNEQIRDFALFKRAVHEGLDELEAGISILNKRGEPLVENKAAREVSRKLGCHSTHLLPQVHRAIQKAKFGHPTETILKNHTVRASSWGSLNNGCVLLTRQHATIESQFLTSFDLWVKECVMSAQSLGVEINLATEIPTEITIAVPEGFCLQSLLWYLADEKLSPKLSLAYESRVGAIQVHFDQELREGSQFAEQSLSQPPVGTDVAYASIGRRVTVELPVRSHSASAQVGSIGVT